MKRRCIRLTLGLCLAVFLILACSDMVGMAGAATTLHEEFVAAAALGDLEQVKKLWGEGADINAGTREEGTTALMEAAHGGHVEIVAFLIEKAVDVNARDRRGCTALSRAVGTDRPDVVELLLKEGADFNTRNVFGETVLYQAIRDSRTEIVKILLGNGVNARPDHYLWTAVWRGDLEIVKLLLDNGASVNARTAKGTTVLMVAAARDHQLRTWFDRLRELLPRIVLFNPFGPVYYDRNTDPQIVKLLLERGADVNAKDQEGWTALKRAQKRGATEIVTLLKRYGAKEFEEETRGKRWRKAGAATGPVQEGFP